MKFGVRELMFVILLVAIPVGAYWWVFKPANHRIEQQRCEVEAKAQKLSNLQKALVGIKDLSQEVDKLKEAVSFFQGKLPKHHEIHRVLSQVTKIAEKHRLKTRNFQTSKPISGPAYSEQPIQMEIFGDFNSYYQFILDLERLPRITKVREMELKKDKDQEGKMESKMKMSIYFDHTPEPS